MDRSALVYLGARVSLGIIWLYAGIEKLIVEIGGRMATSGFLSHMNGTFSFLFSWMAGNPIVDSLVVYGEIAIGIALVLGIFTKFGAFMGALQSTLFALATYPTSKDTIFSIFGADTIYALFMLTLAVVSDMNFYSIDEKILIAKKIEKHPMFKKIFLRWLA